MDRYRSYGAQDDQPAQVGDDAFLGVDEYNAPENIKPGNVQNAINCDFTQQDVITRGGFVARFGMGQYVDSRSSSLNIPRAAPKWTARSAATASTFWNSIAYGSQIFVAVGDGGVINTSPDGTTWTARTSPGTFDIKKVVYANGVFVAVGSTSGTVSKPIIRSTDGVTWSFVAGGASGSFTTIVYGGTPSGAGAGIYWWLAIGNGAYCASTDNGATFGSRVTNSALADATDAAFGNNDFLAVTSTGKIVTCPLTLSGIVWTIDQTLTGAPNLLSVNYCGGCWIATGSPNGSQNAIFTSVDSVTWTSYDGYFDTQSVRCPICPDRTFIMVGGNDGGEGSDAPIYSSLYATNFTKYYSDEMSGIDWRAIAFGNGVYVAVASTGNIATCNNFNPLIHASGLYSDPAAYSKQWIMALGHYAVYFYADGESPRRILLDPYTVNEQSTILQANNYVYIFRGSADKPLYWDGNWNGTFVEVPNTTLPTSFNSIPNSNQATYYQNRLWVRSGKDGIAASDVLSFTDYDPLANEFNLNTGTSDYLVATFPFGQNSLIGFKNKSVLLLQNVEGSLSDVTVTEITRQVGLVGINAVCSIGPDLAYVSNRNINLLTLTSTNNSLQHKTLPLSAKIRRIMDRVNWQAAYKISLGYWNNRLYVALPLDNSAWCNAIVVYNFITENWYGEWNFDTQLNFAIQGFQVADYLGLQRLHAITEDGRILVTDEGRNDISVDGTSTSVVAEIASSVTTRAYPTSNINHFQRRLFMDAATQRPEFSVTSYSEGANEESEILTDQTYSRSDSWKFSDTPYDLTNANDDYNRPYRKDYTGLPSELIQCGTGFQPEMEQEFRLPIITRRNGRLSWMKVTNTQGYIKIMSVGIEARQGQRSNLIQV